MFLKRVLVTAMFAFGALGAAWIAAPSGERSSQIVAEPGQPEMAASIADDSQSTVDRKPPVDTPWCPTGCVFVEKCGCCLCNGPDLTGAENGDDVQSVESIILPSAACSGDK